MTQNNLVDQEHELFLINLLYSMYTPHASKAGKTVKEVRQGYLRRYPPSPPPKLIKKLIQGLLLRPISERRFKRALAELRSGWLVNEVSEKRGKKEVLVYSVSPLGEEALKPRLKM